MHSTFICLFRVYFSNFIFIIICNLSAYIYDHTCLFLRRVYLIKLIEICFFLVSQFTRYLILKQNPSVMKHSRQIRMFSYLLLKFTVVLPHSCVWKHGERRERERYM